MMNTLVQQLQAQLQTLLRIQRQQRIYKGTQPASKPTKQFYSTYSKRETTFLKHNQRFSMPNVTIYRNDRLLNRRGEVMVLVKNKINHHEIAEADSINIDSVGLHLTVHFNRKVNFYSVYIQPNRYITRWDIEKLFRNQEAKAVGGDFNAKKHPLEWPSWEG